MEKRVAIVTGGANGIGRHLCEHLLRGDKYHLILADVDQQMGEQTLGQFRLAYPAARVRFVKCDVLKKGDLERVFQVAKDEFGSVHVLVNNAGVTMHRELVGGESDAGVAEEVERCVGINLTAVIQGTRLAVRAMRESKVRDGVVVNISSMSGVIPFTLDPVYTATKFGVVGLTRSCEKFNKLFGVRVNAVCPFFVDTALVQQGRQESSKFDEVLKHMPFVEVEQVVKAIMQAIDSKDLCGACIGVTPKGNPVIPLAMPKL